MGQEFENGAPAHGHCRSRLVLLSAPSRTIG